MATVEEIQTMSLDEVEAELVELAVEASVVMKASTDGGVVDLMYRSPAMVLREQADRYDREDRLVFRLRAAVARRRELTAVPA